MEGVRASAPEEKLTGQSGCGGTPPAGAWTAALVQPRFMKRFGSAARLGGELWAPTRWLGCSALCLRLNLRERRGVTGAGDFRLPAGVFSGFVTLCAARLSGA